MEVDVELVLAVDVSRSMSPDELNIQRLGYAEALTSDAVLSTIGRGMLGRIAVTYVEWAGARSQRVVVPWTLIASAEDAERVADMILAHDGGGLRRTSISGGIRAGIALIEDNGFHGLRRVIDISGDGPNNEGAAVTEARDEAVARGITINGLPLMTTDALSRFSVPDLDRYYEACVIGGTGAFVIPVTSWDGFADAVRRKLVLEIATPVPRIIPAQMTAPYNCLVGEELWERNMLIFGEP